MFLFCPYAKITPRPARAAGDLFRRSQTGLNVTADLPWHARIINYGINHRACPCDLWRLLDLEASARSTLTDSMRSSRGLQLEHPGGRSGSRQPASRVLQLQSSPRSPWVSWVRAEAFDDLQRSHRHTQQLIPCPGMSAVTLGPVWDRLHGSPASPAVILAWGQNSDLIYLCFIY